MSTCLVSLVGLCRLFNDQSGRERTSGQRDSQLMGQHLLNACPEDGQQH